MNGVFEAAGDVATGGVIAQTLDPPARGGHAAHGGHCLNCGTALRGAFCHSCGQTAHLHNTLASIGHDVLHGVFHFEGKVWHTLPLLFFRPGTLTRRYIAGERVRFVSPLALFLFSVFLMVATFETIGGPFGIGGDGHVKLSPAEIDKELTTKLAEKKALEAKRVALVARGEDTSDVDDDLHEAGNDISGLQAAKSLSQGKISDIAAKGQLHTGFASADERIKEAAKSPELAAYKMQTSAYKLSWALIPISLPFIWLLFAFRRDVGPYHHAIFAIYSLSAMTLGVVGLSVLRVVGAPSALIGMIFALGPPLHMYKQLRGAYGIGRFGAAWRTIAMLFFAAVAGLLFFILIAGIAA